MTDAAAQLEAAKQAVADAQAALAKAQSDAETAAAVAEAKPPVEAGTGVGPLDAAAVETIKAGYAVEGLNGDPLPDAPTRSAPEVIPIG